MEDIKILEELISEYKNNVWNEYPYKFNEEIIQAIENLIVRHKELEERFKKIKQYIENEMYIDDNPTICGDEEDTITELPISLNLYNEGLRELLELLES